MIGNLHHLLQMGLHPPVRVPWVGFPFLVLVALSGPDSGQVSTWFISWARVFTDDQTHPHCSSFLTHGLQLELVLTSIAPTTTCVDHKVMFLSLRVCVAPSPLSCECAVLRPTCAHHRMVQATLRVPELE